MSDLADVADLNDVSGAAVDVAVDVAGEADVVRDDADAANAGPYVCARGGRGGGALGGRRLGAAVGDARAFELEDKLGIAFFSIIFCLPTALAI
jgi:hypothetical protein